MQMAKIVLEMAYIYFLGEISNLPCKVGAISQLCYQGEKVQILDKRLLLGTLNHKNEINLIAMQGRPPQKLRKKNLPSFSP